MPKTKILFALVFIFSLTFFACSESGPSPVGQKFALSTSLAIFYENGAHEDLLENLEQGNIQFIGANYWQESASALKEETLNRYFIPITTLGHYNEESFQFYIQLPDLDLDTFDVKYNFLKSNDGLTPIIEELKYNGAIITEGYFSNHQQIFTHDKVYVLKKGDETETSWTPFEDHM